MPKRESGQELLMNFVQLLQEHAFQDRDRDSLLREIARLPQRDDLNWAGLIQELDVAGLELPLGTAPTLCLLLRPESAEASFSEMAEDREEAELMLLQAILEPDDEAVEVYRPGVLFVPDVQQAFALDNLLRETGIRVEVEPSGELAGLCAGMLSEFREQAAASQLARQPKPFLSGLPEDEVRDYVAAFERFMSTDAWAILPPDRPLFAAWTDGAGQRRSLYATVMGDLGESYGLAFFADWLTYAEHLNNAFDEELVVSALEGLEAVSEGGEDDFAPEDWATLKRLKLLKGRRPQAPALLRMGLEGALPTRTPVPVITGILNVLADRARKMTQKTEPRTRVTSLKGRAQGVEVRYPGKPRDELRPEELTGAVTLHFTGGRWLPDGETFSVTGPSGELLSRMRPEIQRQLEAADRQAANTVRHLQSVLPFRITRPVQSPDFDPADFDAAGFGRASLEEAGFAEAMLNTPHTEDLRVWESHLGSPPVTLAQLTRREGLEASGASIRVEFSPEPCEGFSWTLSRA